MQIKQINIPVDTKIHKWRLRTKACVFIMNAGHGGIGGRNGLKELILSIRFIKSPIKLIIRSQNPIIDKYEDPRVEYVVGDLSYEDLFTVGDVFVYPDKFGGSCLPLQEAFASGMLVMATNRYPSNKWLPNEPLIPIKGYKRERISVEFDSAIVDPKDIAKCIDDWYDKDITEYSLAGKKWAKDNSWDNLKKQYEAI